MTKTIQRESEAKPMSSSEDTKLMITRECSLAESKARTNSMLGSWGWELHSHQSGDITCKTPFFCLLWFDIGFALSVCVVLGRAASEY